MKIIQTFWSGGGNPLEKSYGWPLPEYNMMSWTLSCLSLRRFYDDVELYTDWEGYELLVVRLKLPYTRVYVVYDESLCRPMYWAYAKIKTYSLQSEQFLHVDGDIYITKPFAEEIHHAALVAQNKEIGTIYYRRMIDAVMQIPGISLPRDLEDSITKDSVSSYNMGVFGGTDIKFIQTYCKKAMNFVEKNGLNDNSMVLRGEVDCNILFEQVLFAVMADGDHREVASVVGRPVRDEGYLSNEFCDIGDFYSHSFFHILGGHKRNKIVLKDLCSLIYSQYREYYDRIVALSLNRAIVRKSMGYCKFVPGRSVDGIEKYFAFLHNVRLRWCAECVKDVLKLKWCGAVVNTADSGKVVNKLKTHPYLCLYRVTEDWTKTERELLCEHLQCEGTFPVSQIAIIPFLNGSDCIETPLLDVDDRILSMVSQKAHTVVDVVGLLLDEYKTVGESERQSVGKYFRDEIRRLINHSVLVYV